MNNVVLIGRPTKDPELRYTAGAGNAMCRFTLAVDRELSRDKKAEMEQKGQATADFISCIAWGRTAELIANYVKKGQQVGVQGKMQTSSYEKDDGSRVYRTDVMVEKIEFIGNSGNSNNNYSQNDNFGLGDDAFPLNDEDIPF